MGARGFGRQTFSSLKIPNYRLYFSGQSISLAGTWMQMTAQSWLVLTHAIGQRAGRHIVLMIRPSGQAISPKGSKPSPAYLRSLAGFDDSR